MGNEPRGEVLSLLKRLRRLSSVAAISVLWHYSDAQVVGWKKVTDAVDAKGGRIFLQLWHVVAY
jgi:hypothetical protein